MSIDELLDRLDDLGFPVSGIEPCTIFVGPFNGDAETGWSVSIMGPEVSTPAGREIDGETFEERTLLNALAVALDWVEERHAPAQQAPVESNPQGDDRG